MSTSINEQLSRRYAYKSVTKAELFIATIVTLRRRLISI